jgi:hypothetical protein
VSKCLVGRRIHLWYLENKVILFPNWIKVDWQTANIKLYCFVKIMVINIIFKSSVSIHMSTISEYQLCELTYSNYACFLPKKIKKSFQSSAVYVYYAWTSRSSCYWKLQKDTVYIYLANSEKSLYYYFLFIEWKKCNE